jgi:flagellar biosynthesis protein FlhF
VRLKSYFARDVKAALDMARVELGPEAMLLESRKAPPEARHLGECEVVMALPSEKPESPENLQAQQEYIRLSADVAEMRKQMERMAAALSRSSAIASARELPRPELAEVFSSLVEAEVDPVLAHDILQRLRDKNAEGAAADRALADALGARVRCDPQLGRIAALVGPCGCGKTTTLVKLAVRYGLTRRRPTQIISMDSYRIAAADQLRSFASILDVGFLALETPGALAQAIEEHRGKDLILIDTPGHGPNDLADSSDLAALLSSRRDIDTHLVLTASMKSADLSRVIDRFEIFRPQKLIFTKLDETETFGPILNEAARTDKAVSFLAAGQRIPEDLEPAAKERIVSLVLERGVRSAAAAA